MPYAEFNVIYAAFFTTVAFIVRPFMCTRAIVVVTVGGGSAVRTEKVLRFYPSIAPHPVG